MRKLGYMCGETESYQMWSGTRKDLFGFIDFVAIGCGEIVGVQCCAKSGLAGHRRKIGSECYEAAAVWLNSGGRIEIHAWDRKDSKHSAANPKESPTYEGRVNRLWVEPVDEQKLIEYGSTVERKLPPSLTEKEIPF